MATVAGRRVESPADVSEARPAGWPSLSWIWWRGVGLTAVYIVAGKLGLSLAFVHASATAVCPPTGIALAALLVYGYALWPAVFVGAFVVNVTTAGTVASSLGIAAGNTLEALVGVWLVNRWVGRRQAFTRARSFFAFAALA